MSTAASNTSNMQGLKVTAAKKSLVHNPQAHRRLKLAKKTVGTDRTGQSPGAGQQLHYDAFSYSDQC